MSFNENNKIIRLHERCLRKCPSFKERLAKDNSVSVHVNKIYTMAVEMYKVTNGIIPDIMNEDFKLNERHII